VSFASLAAYAYDGLNRRTIKTVSGVVRNFYYSSRWQVLEERVDTSPLPDRQFLWGLRYIDDLVFRDRFIGGIFSDRFYALQDANWNVTAITSTSGAIQERYRYTAYGMPTFMNASFTPITLGGSYQWETLYAGYRWDSDTGAYDARYRILNAPLGAWNTRDPIGFAAGDANFYRYVGNCPLTFTDPTGEIVPVIVGLVIGVYFFWDNPVNAPAPGDPLYPADPYGGMPAAAAVGAGVGFGRGLLISLGRRRAARIAECAAIHATYTALNCRGCGNCTTDDEVRANIVCLTAEITGRQFYLSKKCDYILPGSIARGSAVAEAGHRQEVKNKGIALAKCVAKLTN